MSITLFTQSVEDATITLTNYTATSTKEYLKNRDNRIKAINETWGSSLTARIEVDYGTSTSVDYFIIGNLKTSGGTLLKGFEVWNGSSYDTITYDGTGTQAFSNTNELWTVTSGGGTETGTKFRINYIVGAGFTVEHGPIFMGQKHEMPVDYDYNNDWITFQRGDVELDGHGYPYANAINTTKKRAWEITFGLTKTQLQNLETQMEIVGYNQKPFFLGDTNIQTTDSDSESDVFLVRYVDQELRATQPGADFFKVTMRMVEL